MEVRRVIAAAPSTRLPLSPGIPPVMSLEGVALLVLSDETSQTTDLSFDVTDVSVIQNIER